MYPKCLEMVLLLDVVAQALRWQHKNLCQILFESSVHLSVPILVAIAKKNGQNIFSAQITRSTNNLCTRPLLSRSSNKSKFTCKGGHESFDHPTTKKKTWCQSISDVEEINTEENSKIGNTTPAEDGRRQRKKQRKKE